MKHNKQELTNKGKQAGYSLIELLVASILMGLVLMVSFSFWRYITDSFNFAFGKSISTADVYRVTAKMVRELREAQYGEDGSYPLSITNDQELAFYADEDEDGQAERVRYWLESGDLMQGVIQPGGDPIGYDEEAEVETVVIDGVENGSQPLFYYYNTDWPADLVNNPLMSDRQLATRMIQVQLWIRAAEDRTASASALTSSVMLRRL
jgi:prepilin-type N-terminal cleavage/methylation domain-containing protein